MRNQCFMTLYLATQPKTTCCVSSKLGPGRVSSTSLMCLQPGLSSCCTSRTDSGPYTVCTYAMSCGLCACSCYWETAHYCHRTCSSTLSMTMPSLLLRTEYCDLLLAPVLAVSSPAPASRSRLGSSS